MDAGVVMPVGPGRVENVYAVLSSLEAQIYQPELVVIVYDGREAALPFEDMDLSLRFPGLRFVEVVQEKHKPGLEQPRNSGVRVLQDAWMGVEYVWFVDSDVILEPGALGYYLSALVRDPTPRILIGPYEWLGPGNRNASPQIFNDPRWPSFRDHEPHEVIRGDLSAGLACFSGNLVWPVAAFGDIGGFWDELHHGRCEDGELGLRAVAQDVPISFVRGARGYHLWHPINTAWVVEANKRDVPMLNDRHPWVQQEGLTLADADGARFDATCPFCGDRFNSALIWRHKDKCRA